MDTDTQLTTISIAVISIGLVVIAHHYAVNITEKPHERTWLSVVVGTSFVQGAIIAAQLVFLLSLGLLYLWPYIIIPAIVGYIIGGIEMIVRQERKFQRDRQEANDYKKNGHNDNA